MRDHQGDDREAPEADARHERRGSGGRRRRSDRRVGVALRAGTELGPSRWVEVDQARVDRFASATEDSQWIHVNRERAVAGPFGTTIAHGFLTLSLLPELWFELAGDGGYHLTVNYGLNRVRFPAPVPVGSRVRATFRIEEVEAVEGGDQARIAATVERQGHDKPVCVAELVFRFLR
ncbi:MAG TPA: MaoC family dehydratase [Gaiellaceae bacterium]|nr:MaoC family dehydratase [Gaiellaceae bacterium]